MPGGNGTMGSEVSISTFGWVGSGVISDGLFLCICSLIIINQTMYLVLLLQTTAKMMGLIHQT